ncbi:MAG: major capsid protein [Armatimonadetes bacterium]|nr:major capsid protein [Armatimonadota bacterium]
MIASLAVIVAQMRDAGGFQTILTNPLAQFGPKERPLLGPTLLPDLNVPFETEYTETGVKYRTVVANDGSRYSPAQKKGNSIVGSVHIRLANQDIASEFTSADYDAAIRMAQYNLPQAARANPDMIGVITVTDWYKAAILNSLMQKREKMRWEAMLDAVVKVRGDGDYEEDVQLSNPTGHRVTAALAWDNNTHDPFDDIDAMAEFLEDKDLSVNRFITSRVLARKLFNNAKVKARVGGFVAVDGATGALLNSAMSINLKKLNAYMEDQSRPVIELYDEKYGLQTGKEYYFRRNAFMVACTTGRNREIDLGDDEPLILQNTLGYHAVGRPAGAEAPGIKEFSEYKGNKPPHFNAEAWQTTFPGMLEPEAIGVINQP